MSLLRSSLGVARKWRGSLCGAVVVTFICSPTRADFELRDQPGERLDVVRDGKLVGRYVYAYDRSSPERRQETYKPFLHLFDAEGAALITKGAGGSFPHHRGIFLGWNKVGAGGKTYDRWHMKGGEQIHEKFIHQNADKASARFISQIRWTGETQQSAILMEERSMTFLRPPDPAYVAIDIVSKLQGGAEPIVLDGDPEHAGLHFRPADNIDRKATRYIFPTETADPRKDRDYPWVGETFTVDDKRFSVVLLHHPTNPKDARFSAYRDYGRFGVFWRTEVPANAPRELRGRFLVYSGEMPQKEIIQQAWERYANE